MMRFESFIGNKKIIERLRTKLREGRFPHGLIFSGPQGVEIFGRIEVVMNVYDGHGAAWRLTV